MANLVAKRNIQRKEDNGLLTFANRKALAEDNTRFCVTKVDLVTQKDKKVRWYLGIQFYSESEKVIQTLTFDQSPSRDEMFELLQEEGNLPQHNCYINLVHMKNGQTYYQFEQDEKDHSCPCSPHRIIEANTDEMEAITANPNVVDYSRPF